MSGPTEFSLESVRQFMLAHDGQVTNHELVKHFRAWLTHPIEKESARQRFKEYVNTLATIRQSDSGEKYLVLKKKFYPSFAAESEEPSLLDEVLAGYQSLSRPPAPSQSHYAPPLPPPQQHYAPPHQPPQPPQHSYRPHPPDLGLPIQQSHPSMQSHNSIYNNNRYSPTNNHSQRSSYASSSSSNIYSSSQVPNSVSVPPTYRTPPIHAPPSYRAPPPPPPSDLGLPLSDYSLPSVGHHSQLQNQQSSRYNSYRGSPTSISHPHVNGTNGSVAPPLPRRNEEPPVMMMPHQSRRLPPPPVAQMQITQQQQQQQQIQQPSSNQQLQQSQGDPSPPPPIPTRSINGSTSSLNSRQYIQRSSPDMRSAIPNQMSRSVSLVSNDSSLISSSSGLMSRRSSSVDALENNKENESSPTLSEKNEKISVKERTKTFNRMASEVELTVMKQQAVSLSGAAVKRRNSRASTVSGDHHQLRRGSSSIVSGHHRDDESHDSSSISTLDQTVKQWMIKSALGDYHTMAKMLLDDPRLAKHKDFTNGYTALHWACKHGNLDMVKMLCGTYKVDVNVKSHGGYTPLHMSCQFGNQEVFDLLVKAYGADPNLRDNSGKKPRQYMVVTDQSSSLSLSSATFKQLKDRRKHRRQASEKNAGILRFGSLSVKVKKTTEAFNNYFYSSGGDKKLFDSDRQRMPPPKFAPIKKRKSKRSVDFGRIKSAPVTPTDSPVKEEPLEESVESDSEFGFDSAQWLH